MKRMIAAILVLCLLATPMVACAENNNEGPTVTKVADMLYEVVFDEYSSEAPDSAATAEMSGDMGCSGVRNGGFVGRNFDYIMNQCPTFVIRTTAKEGRYATIGVGRLAKINSEMVEAPDFRRRNLISCRGLCWTG